MCIKHCPSVVCIVNEWKNKSLSNKTGFYSETWLRYLKIRSLTKHNETKIEGKFVPVFGSPVHFPKQIGTMGVLCNPSNPALANFPTDSFTNWQWWNLNLNSTTIVLDSISAVTPLVEMIDNFVSNRRLASVFEAKVGKVTLSFSAIDVISDLENRPVAKHLTYMNGASFKPIHELKVEELNKLSTTNTGENLKKKSEDIY